MHAEFFREEEADYLRRFIVSSKSKPAKRRLRAATTETCELGLIALSRILHKRSQGTKVAIEDKSIEYCDLLGAPFRVPHRFRIS